MEPDDIDEHGIYLHGTDQVPNGPVDRRRKISTELPSRPDPYKNRPSLSPYQAPQNSQFDASRRPTNDIPSPLNNRARLAPVVASNHLSPASPAYDESDAVRARRGRRLLLPALGLIIIGALLFFFGRSTGSYEDVAIESEKALASQSADVATSSTLETRIVDLDEVPEEDTMRLEIPLETADATSDADVEVNPSLPPLKFTIADGKVLLSGTAQTDEQANAMKERASLVFAGVELVADYQVDPAAPSPVSGVVVQKPVVFQTGSAVIRPEYYAVLDACADVLQSQSSLVMTVAGHTDNVGSSQINLALAEQRAQAVIDYYVTSGLDREQFERLAVGDLAPISTNETEQGRQDNRRTDLEFEGIFKDVIGATGE